MCGILHKKVDLMTLGGLLCVFKAVFNVAVRILNRFEVWRGIERVAVIRPGVFKP